MQIRHMESRHSSTNTIVLHLQVHLDALEHNSQAPHRMNSTAPHPGIDKSYLHSTLSLRSGNVQNSRELLFALRAVGFCLLKKFASVCSDDILQRPYQSCFFLL